MRELPTGTVSLLFTDIEGSTRLLQQLGKSYASVLEECRHLLRAVFAQYHGHEVDTQGDAFFVAFNARPMRCWQLSRRSVALPPIPGHKVRVRVRMGLHTGEPQRSSEGYIGLDVHHAARIMSAGHGGQIFLSQTTRELVAQALPDGVSLQDLGEYRLKDLQRPSRLFQLVIAGLPADFPRLRTLDAYRHNLPIQPTPFIGREREVATVCGLLRRADVRLLTLTGPGGVGKTRLGLQVAAELADQFADGVVLVRLASVTDPEQVVPAIIQTLSISERSGQAPLPLLTSALKNKQLLLFWIIVSRLSLQRGSGPAARGLPQAQAAGHQPGGVARAGGARFAVPPLSLPDPNRLPDLVTLSQYEAVALFFQRAQAVKADFAMTNANAPAVRRFARGWMDFLWPLNWRRPARSFFRRRPCSLAWSRTSRSSRAEHATCRFGSRRYRERWPGATGCSQPEEQLLFRASRSLCMAAPSRPRKRCAGQPGNWRQTCRKGLFSLVDKSLLRQQERGKANRASGCCRRCASLA